MAPGPSTDAPAAAGGTAPTGGRRHRSASLADSPGRRASGPSRSTSKWGGAHTTSTAKLCSFRASRLTVRAPRSTATVTSSPMAIIRPIVRHQRQRSRSGTRASRLLLRRTRRRRWRSSRRRGRSFAGCTGLLDNAHHRLNREGCRRWFGACARHLQKARGSAPECTRLQWRSWCVEASDGDSNRTYRFNREELRCHRCTSGRARRASGRSGAPGVLAGHVVGLPPTR